MPTYTSIPKPSTLYYLVFSNGDNIELQNGDLLITHERSEYDYDIPGKPSVTWTKGAKSSATWTKVAKPS